MKKYILKIAGGIVGVVFVVYGIHLLFNPLFDKPLETINAFSALIVGGFFIKYAITGNKKKDRNSGQ